MPEFVALPIFDEDGRETGRVLKVDTRHFLGEGGSEIAHRYIEVVTKNSMYEVEYLDRIVSGLKPLISYKKQKLSDDVIPDPVRASQLRNRAFINAAEREMLTDQLNDKLADQLDLPIELVDVPSKYPSHTWWRKIPGYSDYIMSANKRIATASDEKSVSIMRGRIDNVLLTDDDGVARRLSVDFLFQKTFPELAK